MALCKQSTEDQQGHCSQRLRHTCLWAQTQSFDATDVGKKETRQGKFGPVLQWRVCASCLESLEQLARVRLAVAFPFSGGSPWFPPSHRGQNARRKLAPSRKAETCQHFKGGIAKHVGCGFLAVTGVISLPEAGSPRLLVRKHVTANFHPGLDSWEEVAALSLPMPAACSAPFTFFWSYRPFIVFRICIIPYQIDNCFLSFLVFIPSLQKRNRDS